MAAVRHLSSKYCKSPNKRRVSIKRQVSDKRRDPNRRRIITGGYDGMYGNDYTLHDVKLYVIFICITSKQTIRTENVQYLSGSSILNHRR